MDFNELYVETCSSASILAASGDADNLKKLVSHGIPTNGQDNKGYRALHYACYNGHLDCINILLKADDVDINATTYERQTALYLTCDSRLSRDLKYKVADLLLRAGADPNCENQKQYMTILNLAVSSGDLLLTKLLLKFKVNVNENDDVFGSTLNAAVKSESLEMVKLITEQRLDFNFLGYLEEDIINFFHIAVLQKNMDILKHLVKNPQSRTKINSVDSFGRTCLLLACIRQYREAIDILLDHGADPNIKNRQDELPILFLAEYLKDEDFNGPDSLFGRLIKLTNIISFKKPRYCSTSFYHKLPFYQKSIQIFDYLNKNFPNLSLNGVMAPADDTVLLPRGHKSYYGEIFSLTPLAYCCDQILSHKNYDIFRKMVEYESNINDISKHKIPALIVAMESRNPDLYIIEHLIRNGASIWTTLGEGSTYGYPSSLKYFLMNSPDPSVASELLFSLVVPSEYLFEYDQITSTFKFQAIDNNKSFSSHARNVSLRTVLKICCSVTKFSCIKIFKDSHIQEVADKLFGLYSVYPDFAADVKEFQELRHNYLNIARSPKSLKQLACLQIRDTLWKNKRSYFIPLFQCIDELFKELELPHILKDQLFFR